MTESIREPRLGSAGLKKDNVARSETFSRHKNFTTVLMKIFNLTSQREIHISYINNMGQYVK